MAIRKVIQLGDPRLKAQNKEIIDFQSEELKRLLEDLKDTMLAEELIGIAAPQIAENFKVFITEPRVSQYRTIDQADSLRVYINPEIVYSSPEEVIIYEGCGCTNASIFGPVKRAKEITIVAFDENGKKFSLTADGLLARVIQHEYDHLNGIEFVEKVHDNSKFLSTQFYIKDIKNSKEQLEASKITRKEFKLL